MIETQELGDEIECLLYEKDVQGSYTSQMGLTTCC